MQPDRVLRPRPALDARTAPIATALRSIPDRKVRGRRRVAEVIAVLRAAPQEWGRNGWTYTLDAEPWVKIAEKDIERAAAVYDLTVRDGVRTIFHDRIQCWDGTPVLTADGTQREETDERGVKVLRDNFREDPVEAARSDLEHTVRAVTKGGFRPWVKDKPGTVDTFFGITGDSHIESEDGTYATARTGGTLSVGSFFIRVGQRPAYGVYEGFIAFDTSSIADGEDVSQVDLSLYLISDSSTTDFTTQVRPKTWTPSGLTTADWVSGADLGSLSLLASISSNGIGSAGYKTLTENGTNFRSAINLTGNSEFILTSDRHVSGDIGANNEYVTWGDADQAGTDQDPKLVVTHEAPAMSGTGAFALWMPAVAASGKQVFGGTSALSLWTPEIAGSGAQVYGGTAALGLWAPVLAGAGTHTPTTKTGTGALTMAFEALAGVGGMVPSGTAALALWLPALDGAGATKVTGTGTFALWLPAIDGAGTQTDIQGSGSLALMPLALAGTGGQVYAGTGALALWAPELVGAGALVPSGTGAFVLPFPALAGVGDLHPTGTAALALWLPAVAGLGTMPFRRRIRLGGAVVFADAMSGGVYVSAAPSSEGIVVRGTRLHGPVVVVGRR